MDDFLGFLGLWLAVVFLIYILFAYIIIPYWYVFLIIALIIGLIIGIPRYRTYKTAKERKRIEIQIHHFPDLPVIDITHFLKSLTFDENADGFDHLCGEYQKHISKQKEKALGLNAKAQQLGIQAHITIQN